MKQEEQKAFAARICQANRSELTVIIFELLISELKEGIGLMEDRANDVKACLQKAQRYLTELMNSLDFQYALAGQLFSLYRFWNQELIVGIRNGDKGRVEVLIPMMEELHQSFAQIAKQDSSMPLMENTQKVYAGLTYGKHSLSEVMLDQGNGQRGYRV